ncbi:ParB/RepB/Spo0J family partition protein [Pelagicoccus sp. SDUM812005]|uniref:ParB/RepB/Spo0J family partition protein n=1 Tax=Pelagicoccus sp. SDUM812005 TaxID=3041257 RepID=UPI00280DD0AA|nr:ParB/RepB/Spo0J family partition protein [Pelagicoccus sp. SDUM812005]MDQ8179966.1 ParB/RepB/Spo0J family partition protein [Pelagicoccus sp. SDUM812005]
MAKAKPRLGKGLAGLISGNTANKATAPAAKTSAPAKAPAKKAAAAPAKAKETAAPVAVAKEPSSSPDFLELPVSKVEPNPHQPRREFEESQLTDLAESIRSEGLIQPIVVREVDGRYQLIAGERRLRAFKMLKLGKIPARIIKAGDSSSASMALIENLQRENLNPIEESMGYASLLRDFDLTQEQVAERVGKGRATIANSLRLLTLPDEVRGYLSTGLLSTGHAKVLLGLEAKQEQTLIARRIIEEGVSVRGAESLIDSMKRSGKGKQTGGRSVSAAEAAAIEDIEKRMVSYLNAKVALKHAAKKGKIVIEYTGNDDLQRILDRIGLEER